MELELLRFSSGEFDTLGILLVDGKFEAFTLEDEHRDVKVSGETRIPKGEYQLDFIRYDTPLTKRYRNKFDWFTYHLEIKNVPNFEGIYIHIGNDEDDTAGCVLVGKTATSNKDGRGFIGNSTETFKDLYGRISTELNKGNSVRIKIKDYA